MKSKLTIIIPCKNEGTGIIKCLELIESQTILPNVIIADSSDKKNRSILREWTRHKDWIKIVEGGLPGIARNNGAFLSNTPYILFIDADIWLYDKNILKECLTIAESKKLDLLTCKIRTFSFKYNIVYNVFTIIQKLLSKIHPIAIGGFMLFKTEEFKRLHGFDEKDKIAEDYRLSSKIEPTKFSISNHKVYTTDRRFEKKGLGYMIKLAIMCVINKNNPKFFETDHNYWG